MSFQVEINNKDPTDLILILHPYISDFIRSDQTTMQLNMIEMFYDLYHKYLGWCDDVIYLFSYVIKSNLV